MASAAVPCCHCDQAAPESPRCAALTRRGSASETIVHSPRGRPAESSAFLRVIWSFATTVPFRQAACPEALDLGSQQLPHSAAPVGAPPRHGDNGRLNSPRFAIESSTQHSHSRLQGTPAASAAAVTAWRSGGRRRLHPDSWHERSLKYGELAPFTGPLRYKKRRSPA